MIDRTWLKTEVTDFGGAVTYIDAPDVPPGKALAATNCEFLPGQVRTRKGFGTAYNIAGIAGSMHDWQSQLGNILLYFTPGTGLKALNVGTVTADETLTSWTPTGSAYDSGTETITEDTSTGQHRVAVSFNAVIGESYTLFCDLKAGSRTFAVVAGNDAGGAEGKYFNLSTGAAGNSFVAAPDGYSIKDMGSSVYRCSITFRPVNSSCQLILLMSTNGSDAASYTGNGSGNIYAYRAGVVAGASSVWPTDTILSTTSGDLSVSEAAGSRSFHSIVNKRGRGATQGYVTSCQNGVLVSDKLFSPPMTYVPGAPTEPSAGVVTEGAHRLAYAVETRSGFLGRLSPGTSDAPDIEAFAPISFSSAGSKNLSWVLNPTAWPTDAVKVHVAMTPVSNPNLYIFVPGANATVTGGAADSKTITFNISDEDLLNVLDSNDATGNRFLYTQTTSNTGPFNPHCNFVHGDRMVYITELDDGIGNKVGSVFVSDRNKYQQITLADHLIQLPGKLDITTGFSYGGAVYLFGPHWTYTTHDNGLAPVQWPIPVPVDEQKGTLAVRGVDKAANGEYAWVADRSGLYAFNGRYSELPISYEQTDQWNRINWNYAYQVQVKDFADRRMVMVLAPLDAATSPSHLMVWDYTNGIGRARFSLWNVSGYSIGSMCLVQNDLSGAVAGNRQRMELWLGPSSSDELRRLKSDSDSSIYRDGTSTAIAWTYSPSLFPPGKITDRIRHYGGHFRVKGSGTLSISAKNVDATWTVNLNSVTLSTAPGADYLRCFYRVGDRAYYTLSTNAADAYCILSGITHYYKPFSLQR